MERQPLDIVVIDDHGLFSSGLELLLHAASNGQVRVVGRTEDANEALTLVRQHQPDVAIIDLAMPPPGGLEAIRVVKRNYPRVGVLALSGTEDIDVAIEALRVGADGFLPKSSEPKVLLPPLLALAAGWSVMPRSMAANLAAAKPGHASLERLTPEERKLWRLVAKGLEGNDIAAQLLVSERTARRLIVSLLRRIGAANRIEAAALAGRAGLLEERWDEHPD
jgi:DNA-binding NarL/FixJ family response regulator